MCGRVASAIFVKKYKFYLGMACTEKKEFAEIFKHFPGKSAF